MNFALLGRRLTPALLAGVALLAAACGGGGGSSSSTTASVSDLRAAAPTSASLDLDVAGASGMSTATALAAMSPQELSNPVDCHPHLFVRTAQVVWHLNAVFFRILRHVEAVIAHDPSLVAGDSATWTQTGDGVEVQRQFTISRSSDGTTYTFELDLAPAGQTPPSWVKVLSGTLTKGTTANGTDTNADVLLDYDALHSVLPSEMFTGTITVSYDRTTDSTKPAPGVKKVTTVAFDGFSFGASDPHGPRTGTYTHVDEPGVGGSMTFEDSVVLLCPSNPTDAAADTVTQSRWYRFTDGSVHGRADAKGTGGQIPTGDTWMGVTCYQGGLGMQPVADNSFYWAMKLEDGSGNTVQGSTFSSGAGATACDSAFGAVMSLDNNSTDYAFPAGPISFPNEW
ncbi:MAG TPA: hypothetical protein VFG59_03285 [Anaeromyxobacter sp.]|nr:hypothetical protein [Anaeromyxobacter sp.]